MKPSKTKKRKKEQEFTVVNNDDGNDSFTVRAKNDNEAAHKALEVLGWWVAKN